MKKEDLEILLNTGNFKDRPPDYALRLLEETCARTGLDWKARHVYLMARGGRWAVTLSIDGFRAVGAQDDTYAGQEGPFWTTGPDGTWTDIPPERAPYAAKVGIKKRDGVVTWGVAKFGDYKTGPMWDKFPSTMTAKCAEMLAWRKAFPGRLGGLYGVEEMMQADRARASGQGQEEAGAGSETTEEASWGKRLEEAKTDAELSALGKLIAADKALSTDTMTRLHEKYRKMKSRLVL